MPRILIVEDDADLQYIYRSRLERDGYDTAAARSTAEAIVYLTSSDFDAIILDMNMPDAPGVRVLEFAREDVRLKHVPVVVASAVHQWQDQLAALGVRHYLLKPVKLQDLLSVLQDALGSGKP